MWVALPLLFIFGDIRRLFSMPEKFGRCSLDHVSIDFFHFYLYDERKREPCICMAGALSTRKKMIKLSQPNKVEPSHIVRCTVCHTVQNEPGAGGSPTQESLNA